MGICFVGEKRRFETFICTPSLHDLSSRTNGDMGSTIHPGKTRPYNRLANGNAVRATSGALDVYHRSECSITGHEAEDVCVAQGSG